MPLVFDPGDRWECGISIDWVGRIVEVISGQPLDAYFREKIFAPLGMKDTGYVTSPEQRSRQASVHQRVADGALAPQPPETGAMFIAFSRSPPAPSGRSRSPGRI